MRTSASSASMWLTSERACAIVTGASGSRFSVMERCVDLTAFLLIVSLSGLRGSKVMSERDGPTCCRATACNRSDVPTLLPLTQENVNSESVNTHFVLSASVW